MSKKSLVIVESPTKARTIGRFLGAGYEVTSSMGHIRDLPKSKLGVDVDKNFEPTYEVSVDKKKVVSDLKKAGSIPNYVAIRPSNLYGPNEVFSGHSHIHVIPNLIRKALLGVDTIEVLGDGSQTRPFTYVEDGVSAVVNAIEIALRGKTLEMVYIHGPQVSIRQVVEYIIKETQSSAKVNWKKGNFIGVASRELPHHSGKLLLGWKPKVSIKEGIKRTVEWAKANPDRLAVKNLDIRPLGSTLA